MTCTLCGHEFERAAGARACRGCPLSAACDLARCPNCGFEVPVEPKWIEKLRGFLRAYPKTWRTRFSDRL